MDDGSHTITVKATDMAGNVDQEVITLKVDNSGPVFGTPSVVPVYGPDGTTFTIQISSVTDGGIDTVTAYVTDPNGNSIEISITSTFGGGWQGTLTRGSTNLEGTYTIDSIKAIDKLGNSVTITTELWFVFDRTNPQVSLTSHSNHDIISGTIVLSGTLSDSVSGLDTFTININDVEFYRNSIPTSLVLLWAT